MIFCDNYACEYCLSYFPTTVNPPTVTKCMFKEIRVDRDGKCLYYKARSLAEKTEPVMKAEEDSRKISGGP